MSVIRKAVKTASNFRIAYCGPSKSGKTFTMLAIACGHNPLTGKVGEPLVPGGKVGLIDVERNQDDSGESEKFADLFDFDVIVLKDHHPEDYMKAMAQFAAEGYNPLIIDGITPEWNGVPSGCLAIKDNLTHTKYKGNAFRAWDDVNALHSAFLLGTPNKTGIKNYPGHVFVSVRAKTKHMIQEDVINETTGKTKVKIIKVGMGPIQRPEIDYEFDTFFNLDSTHTLSAYGETRIPALDEKEFVKAGPEVTAILREWLEGAKKK